MPEEALEERELARTEVDGLAVERDPTRCLVEHDRPGDELWLGASRSRAAAAERAQSGRELLVGERLDEVVVRAGIEPGDPVADRVAGGEHQDRDIGPGRADAPRDLEPGDVRQADVEDDDLDAGRRLRDVKAVKAGRCRLDDVAVLLEEPPQKADEARVVLDDEQMHESEPTASIRG